VRAASAPTARDRRAAFERLTRPRALPAVDDPGDGRDASSRQAPRRPAELFTGRPTVTKEFSLSVSNVTRFAPRPASAPVLRPRAQNSVALEYKPSRTVPQPFKLKSVELHDAAAARFAQQQRIDEQALEAKRRYQAVPLRADMLDGPTFVPTLAPPDQVVTVANGSFCRQSDVRAECRAAFDAHTRERLVTEEGERERAAAVRAAAQERERRTTFREQCFRANPVPSFEMVEIPKGPPAWEPTSPHTPHLSTKQRSRSASRS
jgi:hypothetical protein